MSRTIEGKPAAPAAVSQFMKDAVEGLCGRPKRLPPKYFYDERGAELFEEITRLPEYYLTRSELAIMDRYAPDMARKIGPKCRLIEFGSGSSTKVRILLEHLHSPSGYLPVDICREQLIDSAERLIRDFPDLAVIPVCADFSRPFELPPTPLPFRSTVVYFPGSTIGNLEPEEVQSLFRRVARMVGPGGGFLVGVDLRKDTAVLEAAYNDAQGVTEAFNLNMITRLRRDLGSDVRPERFAHLAYYNEILGRIEMHLVSRVGQSIRLNGSSITLEPGETIHTESSYKYERDGLNAWALQAGMDRVGFWTDPERLFSVQFFRRAGPDRV
jgi:dimethylhistidine N-methyltransferase